MERDGTMDTSEGRSRSYADMSDLAWQVVSPDDECIPRIRSMSSDSSSETGSESSVGSESPSTSTPRGARSEQRRSRTQKPQEQILQNKDGAMLSIVWCLSSFEEQASAAVPGEPTQPVLQGAEEAGQVNPEIENPVPGPSSGVLNSSNVPGRGRASNRQRRGRRRHRNRKTDRSKESYVSSDDFGSIESSPEAYRDKEWTGFRFKSKFAAAGSQDPQNMEQ